MTKLHVEFKIKTHLCSGSTRIDPLQLMRGQRLGFS